MRGVCFFSQCSSHWHFEADSQGTAGLGKIELAQHAATWHTIASIASANAAAGTASNQRTADFQTVDFSTSSVLELFAIFQFKYLQMNMMNFQSCLSLETGSLCSSEIFHYACHRDDGSSDTGPLQMA